MRARNRFLAFLHPKPEEPIFYDILSGGNVVADVRIRLE